MGSLICIFDFCFPPVGNIFLKKEIIPTVNYNSALLALGLSFFLFEFRYIFLRGICVHIGVLALPGNLQPSEIDLQSITSRCDIARARVSFHFLHNLFSRKILVFLCTYTRRKICFDVGFVRLCIISNTQHRKDIEKTCRPAATCFCKSGSFFHNHHKNFPPIFGCFFPVAVLVRFAHARVKFFFEILKLPSFNTHVLYYNIGCWVDPGAAGQSLG